MNIKKYLFGGPKLWSVGDHRVKKVKRTELGTHSHKVTRYKCVDCEKVFDVRESFEGERCYEVI